MIRKMALGLKVGGSAQVFDNLSNPLSLIGKPQVQGSIPLASSILPPDDLTNSLSFPSLGRSLSATDVNLDMPYRYRLTHDQRIDPQRVTSHAFCPSVASPIGDPCLSQGRVRRLREVVSMTVETLLESHDQFGYFCRYSRLNAQR